MFWDFRYVFDFPLCIYIMQFGRRINLNFTGFSHFGNLFLISLQVYICLIDQFNTL